MNIDQLEEYGVSLFGERWQTPLARFLGMQDASGVRHWLGGKRDIPDHVEPRLKVVLAMPAFLIAGHYIIHTRPPRFVARISTEEQEGDMQGIVFPTSDDGLLCDFVWWDRPPTGYDLQYLLGQADLALLEDCLEAEGF